MLRCGDGYRLFGVAMKVEGGYGELSTSSRPRR